MDINIDPTCWGDDTWPRLARAGIQTIRCFDLDFTVDPLARQIRAPSDAKPYLRRLAADPDFGLACVSYLLSNSVVPLTGKWVSEKDLPEGSQFFRGPHAAPAHPLEHRFGHEEQAFRDAAKGLGGTPLDYGDASFAIPILPKAPVGLVLWVGDDEFPPRVTFLVDASLPNHFRYLDAVFALLGATVKAMLAAAKDL